MKTTRVCKFAYVVAVGCALRKKATIHQVTTMPATSKNVLFLGHNHLPANHWYRYPDTIIITLAGDRAIIIASSHQYWLLAGGYDLEIGTF